MNFDNSSSVSMVRGGVGHFLIRTSGRYFYLIIILVALVTGVLLVRTVMAKLSRHQKRRQVEQELIKHMCKQTGGKLRYG
jgi:hypothetical protein